MPTPAGDLTGSGVAGPMPYQVTVLASAARTADPVTAADVGFAVPQGATALSVYVSITAVTSTPSTVFNIEGYDKASGTWYVILASAAKATVTTQELTVWPGATVTANVSANAILPEKIRVRPVHGNANSMTYSVGATFSTV